MSGIAQHTERGGRALFLDRDGLLVELVWNPRTESLEGPLRPGDVKLRPGAAAFVVAARAAGWHTVVVSNQPGFAKGECTERDLADVHALAEAGLRSEGAIIDRWEYCHHHPRAVVPSLAVVCDCRKPAPGLLLRAAAALEIDLASSWMVGDRDVDCDAGRRAGCRTLLIPHPRSPADRAGGPSDARATDLFEASLLLRRLLSRDGAPSDVRSPA